MQCIATWAATETELGNLLATFLHSESVTVATRMYLRLTSAEARRSILDTAAKQTLTEDDYDLFSLTMRAIKPIRDRRNDFAHGIWGTSGELPNALLWISADDHIKYRSFVRGGIPVATYLEAKEAMFQSMFVYTKDDLERDRKESNEACMLVHNLNLYFQSTEAKLPKQQALLASPLLQRVKANQGSQKNNR